MVLAGKAFFMVADAIYLFPEAQQRVVGFPASGASTQSSGFITAIDKNLSAKTHWLLGGVISWDGQLVVIS